MPSPHWGRAAAGETTARVSACRPAWSCPLCDPVGWVLPGFSVRGTVQARMLAWVATPFSPPAPSSTWSGQGAVTQAPAPPPHPGLTGAAPSPPGQPQEQTPADDPHAEVGIKPEFKPRGRVAEEEDRNLPSSCTSCRLNPHDQPGRLCLWVYEGHWEFSQKETY